MKRDQPNPILYLYEYSQVPEEILYRKNDEELSPWSQIDNIGTAGEKTLFFNEIDKENKGQGGGEAPPTVLCVGIGTYKTTEDGEIYLCVLIDPKSRIVYAYSLGVYRSPELVRKALEILFSEKVFSLVLLSSRNSIYQKQLYREILAPYPVEARTTAKGTRGGVMAVSTFYSQLMRKKGSAIFQNWQEAVDWLSRYIFYYNAERNVNSRG